jgi:hypothetical protein
MTVVTAVALLLLVKRKRLFMSREERLLARFCLAVKRDCSVDIHPGEQGLFEIADSSASPGVREFVEIYAGAVYRDRRLTQEEFQRLKRIVAKGFII